MKRQAGFTLIEALAATALAAIMMTAVMSVVSAIARGDKTLDTPLEQADWHNRAVEVIQRDLRHADAFQSLDGRIILTGHISLDRETLRPTHRPAEVTYAATEYADQSWLIRTQTDPEDRSLHNSWTQVVCSGIRGISVTSGSDSTEHRTPAATQSKDDPTEDTQATPGTAIPVDTATLTLTWDTPEAENTSTTLLIR